MSAAADSRVPLTNGTVDLLIDRTFGPRIVRYGFVGGANALTDTDLVIETRLGTWRAHGGHRLWVAPESNPGSYAPDDRRSASR